MITPTRVAGIVVQMNDASLLIRVQHEGENATIANASTTSLKFANSQNKTRAQPSKAFSSILPTLVLNQYQEGWLNYRCIRIILNLSSDNYSQQLY